MVIFEQEQRTHSSQLAAGLVSAFNKINIHTSGDSSRLAAGSFNPERLKYTMLVQDIESNTQEYETAGYFSP